MIWKSLLALVAGFFGGWWVSASAGLWYMDKAGIFDRDGGGSMGVFFVIGPFCGAIAAIALAAVTVSRERARLQRLGAGLPPESPSTGYKAWRAALSALAVYFGLWLLIGLFGPFGVSDTATLVMHEGVPILAGIGAAIWAWLRRA